MRSALLPAVPPGLSMSECENKRSASGSTAYPGCPTIHQSLGPAVLPRVPSAPAACHHPSYPSYQSGRMFLLYLLGCRTSVQFDFLSVLVVLFCFLKLLLSLFWLCEEAQCVYLCLHLGFHILQTFKKICSSTLYFSKNL